MTAVGIDLTPIQGPHRMRGVGSTVINFMRCLPDVATAEDTFVLYLQEDDSDEVLQLIHSERLKNFEVRYIDYVSQKLPSIKTIEGLLSIPQRLSKWINDRRLGTKRITDLAGVDVFLQFEQDIIPPNNSAVPVYTIAYDLIPYVLEAKYLWNYRTARNEHRYSRRGALLTQMRRQRYINTIKLVAKRSKMLLAISENTKKDFMKYARVPESKIEVVYLGVNQVELKKEIKKPALVTRYYSTPWGDIAKQSTLPSNPFLLFIGGADPRRKLSDLVSAYHLLKAQGVDISLVMAGDTMKGFNSIPNIEVRDILLNSSYPEDIYMLGFVDENVQEWLYKNALAFVYPTQYEGFGLPILEAMQYGTPVIAYSNSSISEISGTISLYGDGFVDIAKLCESLISSSDESLKSLRNASIAHTKKYTWAHTVRKMMSTLQ